MSLLTIVQDAADRIGLVRPSQVVGNADAQARAFLAAAQQEGKALARRHDWQRLIKERTFTATATEEQSGVLPADFERMIPGSFWNRSQDRRVAGPLSPQRWQLLKSGLIVMPWDSYRVRGDSFLMNPTPTANDAFAFEYVSTYWCGAADATTPTQAAWVADTDIGFLDEELMTLGVMWRFKKARGLEYAEDMQEYELQVARAKGADGGMADLDMGLGDDGSAVIDPYITDGNWSIN
jgi:hypothetical protein